MFPSRKKGGKIHTATGWQILSDAGKALNLPINIGSHTMRKSFASIAACTFKSSIDMNFVVAMQYRLNHSDIRTTFKYLGILDQFGDSMEIEVSEFVLGNSHINHLLVI